MLTIINGRERGMKGQGAKLSDGINIAETIQWHNENAGASPTIVEPLSSPSVSIIDELDARLRGLRSFFNPHNHPFHSDQERAQIVTRNWKPELQIAGQTFLRSARLVFDLARNNTTNLFNDELSINQPDELENSNGFLSSEADAAAMETINASETSLIALADSLTDAQVLCDALCREKSVDLQTWASIGRIFSRELNGSEAFQKIVGASRHAARARLHLRLVEIAERIQPPALGSDVLSVFTDLLRLLEHLRLIESLLRRDYPLLGTLPVFSLIHEDTSRLLRFIETRALRTEPVEEEIFGVLDGTSYAVGMELRKVFAHELIGLGALRQAPLIYAKVENAYGLLRDSFQQSIVALAQSFDPSLDGAELFDTFKAKLEQSLRLRRDLWTIFQLVRRMERERDLRPFAPLLEHLQAFQRGSMRYLMYKDWEAYERFVEEASAARGAVELAPVLHRFGTYLETLFGQINMRAALAAYPFDYPSVED
jgi:hypothetical protein